MLTSTVVPDSRVDEVKLQAVTYTLAVTQCGRLIAQRYDWTLAEEVLTSRQASGLALCRQVA